MPTVERDGWCKELTLRYRREVYKARSLKDGSAVALKKILMHNEKDGVSGSKLPLSLVHMMLTVLCASSQSRLCEKSNC